MTPVLWDFPKQTVYSPASGATAEKLTELFERTFRLELEPLTAGTIGAEIVWNRGRRRDYEDLRRRDLSSGPEGESQHPEYPWTAKGRSRRIFWATNFCSGSGTKRIAGRAIKTESSAAKSRSLSINRSTWTVPTGRRARMAARRGPSRMPEARDGLRSGKVPRKAGLVASMPPGSSSLQPERRRLCGVRAKLPEIEEADTPRTLFEERVTLCAISGNRSMRCSAFLKVRRFRPVGNRKPAVFGSGFCSWQAGNGGGVSKKCVFTTDEK